jgi:hypothetical protein
MTSTNGYIRPAEATRLNRAGAMPTEHRNRWDSPGVKRPRWRASTPGLECGETP